MAINTTAIKDLLRPGLKTVWSSTDLYPTEWSEIFTRYSSDKAVEIDAEVKLLGLAQIRPEGSATAFDTMGERSKTNYINQNISIGFIITLNAIEDNLYKAQFPMQAKALKSAMMQTQEIIAANVINNGESASFPGGDGVPLFSTAHPIDGGTVANKATIDADLNETSLENAIIAIQRFQSASGLIVMTKPQKLVVPTGLQFQAERLCKSQFRTNTANNDISAIYSMGAIPMGSRVNHFFTNQFGWIVTTGVENGFKFMDRKAMEVDIWTEPTTDNLQVKAVQRYSYGWSDFRAAYGSFPTT